MGREHVVEHLFLSSRKSLSQIVMGCVVEMYMLWASNWISIEPTLPLLPRSEGEEIGVSVPLTIVYSRLYRPRY